MFRPLLRNAVFQTTLRNINGGGGGGGEHSTTHFLHFLLLQNPSLLFIRSRSISSSSSINHTSSSSSSSSSSFVLSYLMNTCGLSEDKAIAASKRLRIHFQTSSRPDSVLTLLEINGFTKPHISKLISRHPVLLLADPDKTLKPKFDFFNSIGLSGLDLVKVLFKDPNLLLRSLEKHIIPTFTFLKSVLHSDKSAAAASLKRSPWFAEADQGNTIPLNIGVLLDQSVPEYNIAKLLQNCPQTLNMKPDRLKEIVEEVRGLGFDPSQIAFVLAINVFHSMTKSTREAKLELFRRWGWSEYEIQTAFRKQPRHMMVSEKKIIAIMGFLVNQMGCSASYIAKNPNVLMYSLEKRIIPRCRLLRILVSKGLVRKEFRLTTVLQISEKSFLENYVIKYEKENPELLKVYQGDEDLDYEDGGCGGGDGDKMKMKMVDPSFPNGPLL